MGDHYLVVADVDKIQGYVFAANRLRAIRGASLVISELDFAISKIAADLKGSIYRSSGGTYVGQIEKEHLDEFYKKVSRATREIGGEALSITIADTPLDLGFDKALMKAFAQLRYKKDSKTEVPISSPTFGGGFVRHCNVCLEYPSQSNPKKPNSYQYLLGDSPVFLCESCWKRMEGVSGDRLDAQAVIFEEFLTSPVLMDFDWPEQKRLRFPYDMESLWDSDPTDDSNRFMALMVADGNAVGKLVEVIDSPDLYTEFSNDFSRLTIRSMAFAASHCGLVDPEREYPRLVPIISGGDDLSLLLPAQEALEFAGSFALAFETFTKISKPIQKVINKYKEKFPMDTAYPSNLKSWPIAIAIGLVIAKPHFPISAYYSLANQLKGNAKAKFPTQSAIDFIIVTTPGAEGLAAQQAIYEHRDAELGNVQLTYRPYSLDAFPKLLILSKAFRKGLARGHRKELASKIWQGVVPGESVFSDAIGRMSSSQKVKMQRCLQELNFPNDKLFSQFDGVYVTPVLDALELVDLLGEGD